MSQTRRSPAMRFAGALAIVVAVAAPVAAGPRHPGPWGPATLEVGINSPQADGCPIESLDGRRLYIASTRPGAVGGEADPNDIWVAHRRSVQAPWGAPVHLAEPVNSGAADYCPTPIPGGRLFFVSTRSQADACGAGDIYRTRQLPIGRAKSYRAPVEAHMASLVGGWVTPVNLGCDATGTGPNFAGGEFSPSIVWTRAGTLLFFSSTGRDGLDQDIYVSRQRRNGSFGPATQVAELSTPANDQMPNVSPDGLEIVFSSDRPDGAGALDVYTATRASTSDPWSVPINLGSNVNTAAAESRPSLSGDGTRLHFGRLGDIWLSTRDVFSR